MNHNNSAKLPWDYSLDRAPRVKESNEFYESLLQSITKRTENSNNGGRTLIIKEDSICRYRFPWEHPMVPTRAAITYDLLRASGVLESIDVLNLEKFPFMDQIHLTQHSREYLMKLQLGSPLVHGLDNQTFREMGSTLDTPVNNANGAYQYSESIAKASIMGAHALMTGEYDYVFNWAGGMHHGCTDNMAGFCYINDISEAISVLLSEGSPFQKVLYIDIDVHHGDGVEVMSGLDPRVTTLSFHHFDGNFFPGTGWRVVDGNGQTSGVRVNVPLAAGLSDVKFNYIVKRFLYPLLELRSPEVIVLQAGGDSLAQDPLGCWSLSTYGHASIFSHLKVLGLPILIIGGGGYNIRNVPRVWAFETALLCGIKLPPWNKTKSQINQNYSPIFGGVNDWISSSAKEENDSNAYATLGNLAIFYLKELKKVIKLNIETSYESDNTD